MFFIGVALLVAVGLGLLISSDAGSLVGLTQQQFGQLVPLVILLIVFAASIFGRRQRLSAMAGNLLAWVAVFGIALVAYAYRDDLQGVAARVFGELVPSAAVIDSENGTASFRRGRDGHFQVASTVNGVSIPLLFDTGASAVVLSYSDATKAGIDVASLNFDTPVTTANGTGRAALVRLDRIEVGGIARRNIRAFVAERGALEGSLLGMTFLETLSRYGVSGNRLELAD
ncbi:MAG TPA: TIGR02281 family clan AA aspartic protease [Devosia sp.]|nr:TIGR02281 family clan AA aspartic protease [Devosia sp.]